jgi:hypothetical protein
MSNTNNLNKISQQLSPYSRIDAYEEWIPQFNDGSGWNTTFKDFPYFYEHISFKEVDKLKSELFSWLRGNNFKLDKSNLYKVTAIVVDPDYGSTANHRNTYHNHKNTYFVKGNYLEHFLAGFSIDNWYHEEVIRIEEVEKIPNFKNKLVH